MSNTRRSETGNVKVVVIETQHVHTDAVHFKSVVQNLTGKNSTFASGGPAKSTSTPERSTNTSAALLRSDQRRGGAQEGAAAAWSANPPGHFGVFLDVDQFNTDVALRTY